MALMVLLKRSKLTELQGKMKPLEDAAAGFAAREADLGKSIEEAKTDEERSVVQTAVEDFEAERKKNTEDSEKLRADIKALEDEIRALEAAQTPPEDKTGSEPGEREGKKPMEVRGNFFGYSAQERDAIFEREDVKQFCQRAREFKGTQRSVTGAELGIPEVFMPILRNLTEQGSKLMKFIKPVPLKGKARQNIAGVAPEAIWVEAAAAIPEMTIDFKQLEMDGYKVCGYIAVPNSDLEDDSDLQLVSSILTSLGNSLGKSFDKAAAYGTGTKMPVGWVTRLAAAVQPAWWGANQGSFTDLSLTNVLKLDLSAAVGAAFFAPLITALGVAKPDYSDGTCVWIMNHKTHMDLLAKAVNFDAAGALVAGMKDTMPVIGGTIVELDFMSDYDITGGYISLERMVERSGASIQSSDIPMFLQDQTVFKAGARYDGKPAIGEAFVAVNYANVAPATTKVFTAAA